MREKQLKQINKYFEDGAMRVVLFTTRNRTVVIDDDGTTRWHGFGRRRPADGIRGLRVDEVRPVYIGDGYGAY